MPALGKPYQLKSLVWDIVKTAIHAGKAPAHGDAQGMKSFTVG
jgi:hypothetical protein